MAESESEDATSVFFKDAAFYHGQSYSRTRAENERLEKAAPRATFHFPDARMPVALVTDDPNRVAAIPVGDLFGKRAGSCSGGYAKSTLPNGNTLLENDVWRIEKTASGDVVSAYRKS
jgi:hypothetical protein